MLSTNQDVLQFFERAKKEALRYGKDPFVFLRELVQNSRDALARNIHFSVGESDGNLCLSCQDDGTGMSAQDMQSYLLRLYASKKEKDPKQAGFFGVGFWSVLLFDPDRIDIETTCGGRQYGLTIDLKQLTIESYSPPPSLERGTRIQLSKKLVSAWEESSSAVMRDRLLYYAAHVKAHPHVGQLSLWFNGEKVNRPFPLPAIAPIRIKEKDWEGVLGFGPDPSVRIYVSGLLVVEASTLDELLPSHPEFGRVDTTALFPVIRINADGLQVLMDRAQLFESTLLKKLVIDCRQKIHQRYQHLLSSHCRLRWRDRLNAHLLPVLKSTPPLIWSPILFLLVALLAALTLPQAKPAVNRVSQIRTEARPPDQIMNQWQGNTIDSTQSLSAPWDLRFGGTDTLVLQVGVLSDYDSELGFKRKRIHPEATYPNHLDLSSPITIDMGFSGTQTPIVLPTPLTGAVAYSSIQLDRPWTLSLSRFGESLLDFEPGSTGTVRYHISTQSFAMPPPGPIPPGPGDWPEDYLLAIAAAQGMEPTQAVAFLTAFIRARLTYDRSPQAIETFTLTKGTWLMRVLQSGGGDCDILNGVLTLMLRASGIPSHLVLGMQGYLGQIAPELHAWSSVWIDTGWYPFDISGDHHGQDPQLPLESPTGDNPNSPDPQPAGTPKTDIGGPPKASEPLHPTSIETFHPLLGWTAMLGIILALILAISHRHFRSKQKQDIVPPEFVAALFEAQWHHGSDKDPLSLQHRALFTTMDGKNRSLHELGKAAAQHHIVGVEDVQSPLLEKLPKHIWQFHLGRPFHHRLRNFLPAMPHLQDIEPILRNDPLPDSLAQIQALLQQVDPDIRLHLGDTTTPIQQHILNLGNHGRHHLIFGTRSIAWAQIEPLLLDKSGIPHGSWEKISELILLGSTIFQKKEQQIAQLNNY